MPDLNNTGQMLECIDAFVNGDKERRQFVKDFSFEYKNCISKMRLEDPDFAKAVFHYIFEIGINAATHLSDGAFKALVSKRYHELLAAKEDGEYKI